MCIATLSRVHVHIEGFGVVKSRAVGHIDRRANNPAWNEGVAKYHAIGGGRYALLAAAIARFVAIDLQVAGAAGDENGARGIDHITALGVLECADRSAAWGGINRDFLFIAGSHGGAAR